MPDYDDLVKVFARINDPEEMQKFFEEIFTPAERRDFNLRWKLMTMLRAKVSQRKIAAALKISLCKITRGAKILKDPDSVSNKMLSEIPHQESSCNSFDNN